MQKIFKEVNSLDQRCYKEFELSEDLLMENAANSMANFILNKFDKGSKILIVSGNGNNGADGIALARTLFGDFNIELYMPFGTKSNMSKTQLERANKIGIKPVDIISDNYNIVVECLFGSGFNKPISDEILNIISKLNNLKAYKIACDFPVIPFSADTTITMGALKNGLFLDYMKDFTGEIIVGNLGISRQIYEINTNYFLLESCDMKLPFRTKLDSHKGSYGHLAVIVGDKKGAGIIACEAGFTFGAGLVTAITKATNLPLHIMQSEEIPKNTTALALGMGLGEQLEDRFINNDLPKIIDADMFYQTSIIKILSQSNIVLTPHPKEFCSLLKICDLEDITIEELQNNRFKYVNKFCEQYPNVVLLLKGANVLIGHNEKIFINTFGTAKLSFGGSGDVLSGLIGSLLAQKYTPIESAITASLAHTLASVNYALNDYSMKPQDLIDEIRKL